MSRDDQSHLPLTSSHDRRMRDDSGAAGVNVIGYEGDSGTLQSLRGDEKFPYIMVPPDLGKVALYASSTAVPIAAPTDLNPLSRYSAEALRDSFVVGPAIDVRGLRHLSFYLSFVLPFSGEDNENANNALAFIPQVANSGITGGASSTYLGSDTPPSIPGVDLLWHSISVVDPFIRGAFPVPANNPAIAQVAPTYAFRNVHMTELELPYLPRERAPLLPTEIRTVLVFDVAAYEYFRLQWCRVFAERPFGTVYPPTDSPRDFAPRTPRFSLHLQGQR